MANPIRLHTCPDSPPGRAVEMVLRHLKIPYVITPVSFEDGEQFSPKFLKMYPQGELPIIQDGDLIVGESVAIIQYLAEKYGKNDDAFYPKDPASRSVINHHLAFHLSTYQRRLYDAIIIPFDYDVPATEDNHRYLKHACKIFNEFLDRQGTAFAAADHLTLADPPLIMATVVLDAVGFDLTPYPKVSAWYEHFQKACPHLWGVAQEGKDAMFHYMKNPRDMSQLKHPLHPTKQMK